MIVTMLSLETGVLMCIAALTDIIPAWLKSILFAVYAVIHLIACVREMRMNDRISRLEDKVRLNDINTLKISRLEGEAKKRNQTEKGGEAE